MTEQENINRDKIYSLYADEVYAYMLVRRYGIKTPYKHLIGNKSLNMMNLFDFYYPDTPFERMTRVAISHDVNVKLFKEKYNIL